MCRLLGIVGTPPLPAVEVFEQFFPLAKTGNVKSTMKPGHLDGWGVSGFHDGRAVYFQRRAESAEDDKKLQQPTADKAQRSQSPVLLAHLRKASGGTRAVSNTHPFHSRDWAFAHEGTVYNAFTLKLVDAEPQGQTDSERLGLYIIEQGRNRS